MTHYLIVPGYGDSGPEHWQTHFERVLPQCSRIQQHSWDRPVMQDWVTAIHDAVMQHSPETVVLITHSLGGIAAAHWAQRHQVRIKGAMIVAPPDVEFPYLDLSLASFTPIPTATLTFPSIVVGSTNDPWATQARTTLFASNWGSKLVFIGDAGHISIDSGYTRWQEGIRILQRLDPTLPDLQL